MKSILLFFGCLIAALSALSQAPSIQWQKSFGGTNDEYANSIVQTTDGGYAIAGHSESTDSDVVGNHGGVDYWVLKLNSSGTMQWQKSLGGGGDDLAYSIIQTTDGGYAVAGTSNSDNFDVTGNHGGSDYWIVKLNSAGAIEWQKSLGGSGDDLAYSIVQTTDGGYAVAGRSSSADSDVTDHHGGYDYWIVKLDNAGAIQWQKSLGGSGDDYAYSIIQTTEGGYAVAGYSNSTGGDVGNNLGGYDYWIVKLDNAGAIEWQKLLQGTGNDLAYSIIQTSDGGYAVAGASSSYNGNITGNHGGFDYWVVKLNSSGTLQWQKSLGGSDNEVAYSIAQTTDGGYSVAGYSISTGGDITGNHGGEDVWLIKLNSAGSIQWQKSLGGSDDDYARSIIQTTDGGYAVAGYSRSDDDDLTENHGGFDDWIVKLDATTGIQETENAIALNLYPNPASNQLFIETEGIAVSEVTIYNSMGSLVLQVPSLQAKSIDISTLPKGAYIAEIKTQAGIAMKRWVKM